MIRNTIEAETVEEFIKQVKELAEKLSAVETSHDTHTGTDIIPHPMPEVQPEILNVARDTASRIDTMNRILATLTTPLTIAEGGSPTRVRVACAATAWKVLEQYGEDVFKETFEVVLAAWSDKYRFDHWIVKELSNFIGQHWGKYDKADLIEHISRKVGKNGYPISARDFAATAKKSKGNGSATLFLYNLHKREVLE